MARFITAIDLPSEPAKAFAYLADLARTVEWDPGVVAARRLARGGHAIPFQHPAKGVRRWK